MKMQVRCPKCGVSHQYPPNRFWGWTGESVKVNPDCGHDIIEVKLEVPMDEEFFSEQDYLIKSIIKAAREFDTED